MKRRGQRDARESRPRKYRMEGRRFDSRWQRHLRSRADFTVSGRIFLIVLPTVETVGYFRVTPDGVSELRFADSLGLLARENGRDGTDRTNAWNWRRWYRWRPANSPAGFGRLLTRAALLGRVATGRRRSACSDVVPRAVPRALRAVTAVAAPWAKELKRPTNHDSWWQRHLRSAWFGSQRLNL